MITGVQIRMARAALGWKVTTLSDRAEVSWARMQHIERVDGVPDARPEILERIEKVLAEAGIDFLPETEDRGPGVCVAKPTGSG